MTERESLYESILSELRTAELFDTAVTPGCLKRVPTNCTEFMESADKDRILRLLNCDEKYKNGVASDYERFAEWERRIPTCVGNGVAELYRAEKVLLEIGEISDPREAWRKGNERLLTYDFPSLPRCIAIRNIVTDFIASAYMEESGSMTYDELSARTLTAAESLADHESQGVHIVLDLAELPYQKPDPYHASLALQRIFCGEKNNCEEESILSAQLLIDLLLGLRKKGTYAVTLHLRGKSKGELLAYLSEHRLLPPSVRLGLYLDDSIEKLSEELLALRDEAEVLPELILRPTDFGCRLSERLLTLADAYPLSGLRFGGVQTDSSALAAAHTLFCEAFAALLSALCDTEETARAVVHAFLK